MSVYICSCYNSHKRKLMKLGMYVCSSGHLVEFSQYLTIVCVVYIYLSQSSCSTVVDIRLTGETKKSPSPSHMSPLACSELCFCSPRPDCKTTASALRGMSVLTRSDLRQCVATTPLCCHCTKSPAVGTRQTNTDIS